MKNESQLIITGKKTQKKSYQQKTFNNRIKKVQMLRQELQMIESVAATLGSWYHAKIKPLEAKLHKCQVQRIHVLDRAYDLKFFRKREKEKISYLITEDAYQLIDQLGYEDLKPIYEKHAGDSFEEDKALAHELTQKSAQSMLKNMMGVDVDFSDIEDFSDMKAVFEKISKGMGKKEEQERARKQDRAEVKRRAEARTISKSTKAIYNELVKEYHPDREQDEEIKRQKTVVLQQITQAYEQDDLLTLLGLQAKLRNGKDHLENLPDQTLKHYNKILKEQIDEIEGRIYTLTYPPVPEPHFDRILLNPRMEASLKKQREREMKEILKNMQDEVNAFKDKQSLRHYLKEVELEELDDFDFFLP